MNEVGREVQLSFVIPAFNEEGMIGQTIESIEHHATAFSHEILVVDDASEDATVREATQAGATVLESLDGTIGANRNLGARRARGDVLIFLDADVTLTTEWAQRIPSALNELRNNAKLITGSHCNIPDKAAWIERYWFASFAEEKDSRHIGSGHLIMNAGFFSELGGFDETLETGEDYELCARARAAGATILNDPSLKVVHRGFPETLPQFVRREAWHGTGDFVTVRSILASKVSILTLVFIGLHVSLLSALLVPGPHAIGWFSLCLLALAALLAASSVKKNHSTGSMKTILFNAGLFYFYYLGRTLSLLIVLKRAAARRISRALSTADHGPGRG